MFGVTVNDKKGSNKHFAEEIYRKLQNRKIVKDGKNIPRDFYLFNYVVNFLNVNMEYEILRPYFHMYILKVKFKKTVTKPFFYLFIFC